MSNHPSTCLIQAGDQKLADQLKALGHPVRMKLVRHLFQQSDCCCGDLCACFDHSQSTISQHLALLVEAGFLSSEKRGNRMHYTVNPEVFSQLSSELSDLTKQSVMTPEISRQGSV